MEEDLRKLTKSNNRKKAAIIILLFALVLAGIAIFVLVFNDLLKSSLAIFTCFRNVPPLANFIF